MASNCMVKGEIYGVYVCKLFCHLSFLDCLFMEMGKEARW